MAADAHSCPAPLHQSQPPPVSDASPDRHHPRSRPGPRSRHPSPPLRQSYFARIHFAFSNQQIYSAQYFLLVNHSSCGPPSHSAHISSDQGRGAVGHFCHPGHRQILLIIASLDTGRCKGKSPTGAGGPPATFAPHQPADLITPVPPPLCMNTRQASALDLFTDSVRAMGDATLCVR